MNYMNSLTTTEKIGALGLSIAIYLIVASLIIIGS